MSTHLGDYPSGATLATKFNTDVNGSPFTLAGGAVSVWKQGSATPLTVGVVLTVDYQGVTGLHDVAIDLSDPSYASGKDYQVYLSAGSVNGISRIGQIIAEFSIEHRSAAPTAAVIADAVWEEALTDHSGTVGSTAEALGAAGSAGDPWATALPGAYGAGSAGKIIGDNVNATVGSRASQTSVDAVPADVRTNLEGSPPIPVNVTQINDVDLLGDGSATPWGPV